MPTQSAPSILDILTHTPFWVWLALVAVVYLGLKRTLPRDASLAGLMLMPTIMLFLSLSRIAVDGLTATLLAGMAVGALFGTAAGITLERRNPAVQIAAGRVRLPGDWTSLVTILAVFTLRYVGGVLGALSAGPVDPVALLVMDGLSGFFAALLITRAVMRIAVALAPVAA